MLLTLHEPDRAGFRYAWRTLRRSPGFLAVSVATLGLGIGANTAIFNLIDAVMLRALPVPHPHELVLLTNPRDSFIAEDTRQSGERTMLAYPEFERIHERAGSMFAGLCAIQSTLNEQDMRTAAAGSSRRVRSQLVSGDFFGVLKIKPAIGRFFTAAEDVVPGANPVAVLSHALWQREFAGDARVLSQTIRLGRNVFQVIGVAPAGFRGVLVGEEADVWLPMKMQAQVLPGRDYLTKQDVLWLQVMGRLRRGVPRETAQAGVNVVLRQAGEEWLRSTGGPVERLGNQWIVLKDGARGASELRGEFSDPLLLLMGMVALVLLIACANIANLTLARGSGRRREIGVRLALGARRSRVVAQLLVESLVVALAGGLLGIILAAWGTDLLVRLASGGPGRAAVEFSRDYRVLLFTATLSLLAAIVFGLLPAVRAAQVDINQALGASARGGIGSRGRTGAGRVLVVAQVSLSLILLIGAALFLRSLHNLSAQQFGFEREHLLMADLDPIGAGYPIRQPSRTLSACVGKSTRHPWSEIRFHLPPRAVCR